MATKRGFCPYCSFKDRKEHYFQVNPDAKVCYCPHCMKVINPDEAINAYTDHVNSLIKTADFTLYEQGNPVLAYQQYAEVLEFEDYNTSASLGRLLCLLFMSKVRTSFIKEVTTMLETEADQYHKSSESTKYVLALMKMNNIVDQYEEILRKKLSLKKCYYDEDCLKLYIKHYNEMIEFKETLLKESTYISKRFNEQKAELLVNLLEIKLEEQTHRLRDEDFTLVNGEHYRFERMKRSGEVEIKKLEGKHTETKLSRYRMASLDNSNKKTRNIDDIIFKDYTRITRVYNASIWLALAFFILAGGFATLAYFFYGVVYLFYSFVGAGAVCFIVSLIELIVRVVYARQLKKKKKMQIY